MNLSSLSESELEPIQRILTPGTFAAASSLGQWEMATHLAILDREVMDLIAGRTPERVLVIEMPPRHGKSMYVSHHLPAWFVGTYPNKRVLLASYEATFAKQWGRKSRELIREFGHWFGVSLSDILSTAPEWVLAPPYKGGVSTAGVGGPLTGKGADLLIIDDPIKNAEEAMSETMRTKQWDWYQSTASTRIEPGGCSIIMATRWHAEDLIGKLIAEAEQGRHPPIRRLRFQAIDDDGNALWPERWPIDQLEQKRQSLDIFWWKALYQQIPGRHGDAQWPDHYFEDIWCDEWEWPDKFEVSSIANDPSKGSSSKVGDYNAVAQTLLHSGTIYVDCLVERTAPEIMVGKMLDMAHATNPPAYAIGVEGNAFQDLLSTEFDRQCREKRIPPVPLNIITNSVNKDLRISQIGPYLARKKLKFRRSSPGCHLLVSQLQEWPLADYDDGPDALEMALRLLQHIAANPPIEAMEVTV